MDKAYTPCTHIYICLEQLKWNDSLAVSVSRLVAENCPLVDSSEMYCFSERENLREAMTALRVVHRFEFLPQVDDIIRRCFESGLILKWRKDETRQNNKLNSKRTEHRMILTVDHIGGALITLFCGLSMAMLVFAAECVAYRKIKQRNCCRFWFYLSKVLDGRRFDFRSRVRQ